MAHLSNLEGVAMEGKLPEVRLANTPFKVVSPYEPAGDQPQAIEKLAEGVRRGLRYQTLLGVTGSGKTFTMAKTIEAVQKPTLVMAPNKTLAAQLASELREFFPDNSVVYFVSYYDYYQPEAYIPSTDTFIEKDSSVNDEIDRMRHSATAWLAERRDVVIVASVSCIYGLGDPAEYEGLSISLREGAKLDRDQLLDQLVDIQYDRNDFSFERGTFRVRGDVVEIIPAGNMEKGLRVEFFGDEIDRISEVDALTGTVLRHLSHVMVFPASHYATSRDKLDRCIEQIEHDLEEQRAAFERAGRLVEAQRLDQRVRYDIEMLREVGYCNGIENYSRYFDGRKSGEAPFTLLDYFPKDFIVFIDESHVTIPQIRAMYNGDYARKRTLVDYGFRLTSAFDNRPLKFYEFEERTKQLVYVSATPAPYELERATRVVEQMLVTRHLRQAMARELKGKLRGVSAIAPGVLGLTGIETAELCRGLVAHVKPAAVIAIDALAAYESERICTTIQITDTGIEPGSGVGNHRLGLTDETLGVRVIAVGVPMVVYASTIARDAMARLIDEYGIFESGHEDAAEQLLRQVSEGFLGDMVVTPREIDELVLSVADLLSDGLNQALHPSIDRDTLHTYMRG